MSGTKGSTRGKLSDKDWSVRNVLRCKACDYPRSYRDKIRISDPIRNFLDIPHNEPDC